MSRAKRIGAALLALLMLGDTFLPTMAYALSSGPSQPEVQGFKPAGADDLVNLFTGDFSYNIPLLDVDGYPVNLSYTAGVGMDQEASWVGLGWNLNPGVVQRNLRGLPDDFDGDPITRTMSLRPNRTFGLSMGVGLQLYGANIIGLNAGVSPSFNNYYGPEFEANIGASIRSTAANNNAMSCGLGLSSSSNRGLTVSPTIGYDRSMNAASNRLKAGLNFGLSLNSMQGLTNASFGGTLSSAKGGASMAKNEVDKRMGNSLGFSSGFDLGSPTYSPQVTLPMANLSVSFNATGGLAMFGTHPNVTLGAFYSEQHLRYPVNTNPAYGYLHLQDGQGLPTALLDFNREKDGPYSADRAGLGIASLTNDIFSVSGQGVSGSYRAYRSEVGHVFDPSSYSSGSDGSIGAEGGASFGFHFGGDVMVNQSTTSSGDWTNGNLSGERLRYRSLSDKPELEPVFFREANEATVEQDSTLWNAFHEDQPIQLSLSEEHGTDHWLQNSFRQGGAVPVVNYRKKREPRAQVFSYLDHRTAMDMGLESPPTHPGLQTEVPDHHMSEITITGKDGGRYVYGYPAYNFEQKDVEFSIDQPAGQGPLVTYGNEASLGNDKGRDHYYSCSVTPPYAYAFLLTAVVSPDYSDVDAVKGPSDGDLGNYTRFTYARLKDTFHWRTPIGNGQVARWNKGLAGDAMDDKASYVCGTKEIQYLDTIVGRNFIAIFHTSPRHDALGVAEQGSIMPSDAPMQLDSISLYQKQAYKNDPSIAPIKRVHFWYDYSLCTQTPNSNAQSKGKLTLLKVWFTYGRSDRGITTPYVFSYEGSNFSYAMNAQDRWGNYKPNDPALSNEDYPYAEQTDPEADDYAGAWNLTKVRTPSGAKIIVTYEADDYGYVQNKLAMRMLPLTGVEMGIVDPYLDPSSLAVKNKLTFALPAECIGMSSLAIADALFDGITDLYFRAWVNIVDGDHDYVSGYARIDPASIVIDTVAQTGSVTLTPVDIDDGYAPKVNPIYRAGLEFMRLHYPSRLHPGAPSVEDGDAVSVDFLYSVASSITGFIGGIGDFFQGPNASLKEAGSGSNSFCYSIDPKRSWIRVYEPDRVKKGGGHRVKGIRIVDNWSAMEPLEDDKAFSYGKDYGYGDPSGSYGVAAYEPMSGADENPWRQPVYGSNPTHALTPDERSYQETPFGESLFPGPTVGYSKVIVTDRYPSAAAQTAQGTGRVVHEFYTAKDFPTITRMTDILPRRISPRVNLLSLLGFKQVDHMHATQGYVVETNDMHGKPKNVAVYPEGSDLAVSLTSYKYVQRTDGSGRLSNAATVIDPQGHIGRAEIGRQYEIVSDTRQFLSEGRSGGMMLNLEGLAIPFPPLILPVPVILPKCSAHSTVFKSGVLVKKIHRFGLLESVTQVSNGSSVITENLAYDAQTGTVLLTKLTNAFEDPIYAFNFPAYWHYEGMGPAYKNIGVHLPISLVGDGTATVTNAPELFFPGDELALTTTSGTPAYERGWVNTVGPNTIQVVDREGQPMLGDRNAVVVRSGRRNMQDVDMMSLTLQSDPLQGMDANVYANILNAKVKEFKGTWRAECACIDTNLAVPTINDWLLNRLGTWRTWKENVWLTDRTRSVFDDNANIRRDGIYASFSPFYKVLNGHWGQDPAGWTTAREVTDYNSRGQELENKDALGLYSSAAFGYGGSLPIAVAKNARHAEIVSKNFEDGTGAGDCTSIWEYAGAIDAVEEGVAHTGRYGLRVTSADSTSLTADIIGCPPEDCELELMANWNGVSGVEDPIGGLFIYTALNGAAPYTFTLEVIDCLDPDNPPSLMPVGNNSTGLLFGGDGSSIFSVIIRVSDAEGCSASLIWSDQ